MKLPGGRQTRRTKVLWAAGLILAAGVHVVGLVLFRVDGIQAETTEADYSFASLPWMGGAEADVELLREQAYLFDSAPLFLPTRWNSASLPTVRALELKPPDLFELFPARFSYGEADFGSRAIEAKVPVLNLATLDTLDSATRIPFGRDRVEQPRLSPRFALLEVRLPGSPEVVLAEPVGAEGAPRAGRQLWAPAEFYLHVEQVGVVGELVLLAGSGVEEVDLFLREEIRRLLRARMLDGGYYRVLAGP
jgi:hypothetical protein